MGNKVSCKTGMLIYLPVTSRPLISLQKEAVLSPFNFATAHLTACTLKFYLPRTSRPMKWGTLSQRPTSVSALSLMNFVQIGSAWIPFFTHLFAFGHGPNTVSESTVSNTELSVFFCPHRVPGRGLSEFLSANYVCEKANSPSFWQNSPSLPQNSVSSLFRNSTLETVFRPFPMHCLSV